MARIKNYSGNGENIKSVWNNSGDKRYGFVSKDRVSDEATPNTRWKNRYGIGVDNTRSPYSGYSENEIKTLLGTLDYGHDGDTSFAGFTPNFERTSDYYTNGEGNPWHMDYASMEGPGDSMLRAGTWGDPSNPTYFTGAFLGGDKNYIPDFDKTFDTPLGSLELSRNTEAPNSVFADYRPNQYVQALANLLLRGR